MNNIHNNHSFNLVAVPSTPRPRNTDNAQPQTTASLTEKPEESERFRMRRMRIRQYEREQAMEDRAAVMMIQVRFSFLCKFSVEGIVSYVFTKMKSCMEWFSNIESRFLNSLHPSRPSLAISMDCHGQTPRHARCLTVG